jgi:hypothetical protein
MGGASRLCRRSAELATGCCDPFNRSRSLPLEITWAKLIPFSSLDLLGRMVLLLSVLLRRLADIEKPDVFKLV